MSWPDNEHRLTTVIPARICNDCCPCLLRAESTDVWLECSLSLTTHKSVWEWRSKIGTRVSSAFREAFQDAVGECAGWRF